MSVTERSDTTAKPGGLEVPGLLTRSRLYELLVVLSRGAALVLLIVIFGALEPKFLSRANWINTSVFTTTTLILALGETLIVISAGIDLSVGAAVAVTSVLSAEVLNDIATGAPPGIRVLLASLCGVGAGALIGLTNGIVITKLRISPFIATLGMLGVASGVADLISGGSSILVPAAVTNGLSAIGDTVWLNWLPVSVAITLALCVLIHYTLKFTRFGTYTYAIGSDIEAARRAGINVDRHLIAVYSLAGALAGIAGVLTLAQFQVGTPTAGGDTALLNAVAAVVIGGVSLFGGRGGVPGTIIGAAIVSSTVTGLVLVGVQPFWQSVVIGIIIVTSVFVQQLGEPEKRSRRRWRGLSRLIRRMK